MGLKEQVLDYLKMRCEEEGLETKPRITKIASELKADKDDVIKVVEELEAEGIIEYQSGAAGESHVCPVVGPDDIIKLRIVRLVKEKGRTEIGEISRLLGEESRRINDLVEKLSEEGKVKFAGEGGSSWIEPA